MRLTHLIICLFIIMPLSLALEEGKMELSGLFTDSSCLNKLSTNVTAGDLIYYGARLTNTGTVNISHAEFFAIDSFGSNDDKNYGNYTHKITYFDIGVGEYVYACSSLQTLPSYAPTEWNVKIYFRNDVNANFDESPKNHYFNITNDGDYDNLTFSINVTADINNPYTIPFDTDVNITVNITNNNPLTAFNGTLELLYNDKMLFPNGSAKTDILLAPLENKAFNITLLGQDENIKYSVAFRVDHDGLLDAQDNIRRWLWVESGSAYYLYQVIDLYADKSLYLIGDDMVITTSIDNIGSLEWNSTCCEIRYTVAYNNGTAYETMNVSTKSLSAVVDVGDTLSDSITIPVTSSIPLTDFWIGVALTDKTNDMPKRFTNITSYNGVLIPDITSSCTITTSTNNSSVVEVLSCDTTGEPIVFVDVSKTPDSVTAITGTVNTWWSGSYNGAEGIYIDSVDAQLDIRVVTNKIVVLSGLSDGFIIMLSSVTILACLFAIGLGTKKK